jgi:hypothetical protein
MGQDETPGAPPGCWPDPTRPCLLPAVHSPCTITPTAPPWLLAERVARPTSGGDQLGVARPGLLVFTSGHQSQAGLFLPWPSKAACTWRPAIARALGPTALTPAPSPLRGELPPPCAHAHAPNRDRRPGNRLSRRCREVE